MRNKFILVFCEIMGVNLLTLFLVYRIFISHRMEQALTADASDLVVRSGLWIFVGIYLVSMLLIGYQVYRSILIPASKAQEDLKI
jgi:hypothetical protein